MPFRDRLRRGRALRPLRRGWDLAAPRPPRAPGAGVSGVARGRGVPRL